MAGDPRPERDPRPDLLSVDDVPSETWLSHEGFFRVVGGFDEATALLVDPRLEANLAGIFKAVGIDRGPAWDAVSSSLLSLNGPEHRQYRATVADGFTPRAVERSRPRVAGLADEMVAALVPGPVALVDDFATGFVAASTCGHMGIPLADYEPLADAVEKVGYASQDLARRGDAFEEGITALVAYGRKALRDDQVAAVGVLGRLKAATIDGQLPESVAAVLLGTILSAGNEPTVKQLGLAVEVLTGQPDVWDQVGSGAVSPARVVEEVLRFCPTNPAVNRTVTEPVSLHGVDFEPGENVHISLPRCNRDERRFDRPDEFDPSGHPGSHLSFGLGAHYCLGAALARMELQEALRALTARLHCPRLVRSARTTGAGLLGHTELVVDVRTRS